MEFAFFLLLFCFSEQVGWNMNKMSHFTKSNSVLRRSNVNNMFLFYRAFPSCKFAEKCLFIHPNCKYDAKCTKPDCPFTHMSRRIPVLPPKPG